MGTQDKTTKNSIKSKNYPKSKTLRELEKFDIDLLVYCYNCFRVRGILTLPYQEWFVRTVNFFKMLLNTNL